jgi:hypothetical protein
MDLSVNEKLDIIETEYHIPIEDSIRKDVSVMCNLSQGILEKGEARGKAIGEAKIILNMHKNGFTVEQIACATDKEEEEESKWESKGNSVLLTHPQNPIPIFQSLLWFVPPCVQITEVLLA